MKGTAQSTEFKTPQQRAVSARMKNSTDGASSGETEELHPKQYNQVADTKVNFGIQFGSVLEKSDEPQSEFAPLHCTESAKEEKPDAHEHETGLVEILPVVKQANVTEEAVELSNDVKRKPQDRSALECATSQRSSGAGLEEEFENKASGPEAQTSQNTPCSAHLLDEDGVDILCGDAEKDKVERQVPKRKGVHTEGVVCSGVDTLDEKVCFDGEATGETASVEPPLKRRLRRRMGMCGLGDRKRRFLLEGQPCRKVCAGEEREEEELGETDGENHDVLTNDTVEGNSVTALMDNEAAEQMLLKRDAGFLEDISEGYGKAELTGHDPNKVQDQLSVCVMTNDHDMESSFSDNEPDLRRTGTNAGGWKTECSEKHEALSEEAKLQTGNEVTNGSDEVVKEAAEGSNEAPKEVGYVSVGVTEEMLKDSVKVTQEDQIGLEESEMEIGEQCPSVVVTHDISPSFNSGATDKQDPNVTVTVHTENEMALERMEHTVTVATVSTNTAEVRYPLISGAGGQCEHTESPTTAVPESTGPDRGCRSSPKELGRPAAPPAGQEKHLHESMCLLGQDTCDPSLISTVAEQPVYDLSMISTELPQYLDSSNPLSLCSVTDSQLNVFASNMELDDQPIPEGTGYQEDATELVCGLIRELSSLNQTVMAAHREMELLHRGNRPAKPPSRRSYGPRHSEM